MRGESWKGPWEERVGLGVYQKKEELFHRAVVKSFVSVLQRYRELEMFLRLKTQ